MVILLTLKEERGGRVTLSLENEGERKKYSVSAAFYEYLGAPVRGAEIKDCELTEIEREDEKYRAFKKALSLLAYSDKNKKTLYLRLLSSGFSRDAAAEATERCVELGYINEQTQLERAILTEANVSLRGVHLIRNKMRAKGYALEEIDSVWEFLVERGDIDPHLNFKRLCEKKKATSEEERRELRYKFGYGSIDE